jgi:hypothetical protein
MNFITDNRGVSEVVGAILVFGLFVALLAVFQTVAIPAANEEVEYNHNQELQSDMIGLLESASRTGAQGTSESVGVRTGTTYPSRLLFFNPRNPAGRISTVDKRNATVENITATDPIVRKYIDGSTANLSTKRIQYAPAYNQYNNAPTTHLEYGVLYNNFGDEQIIENPGSVVSGNSINLMFFAGNLSRSSASSVSVDTRPTSAPARTVTVVPDGTGNVSVTLPTQLSEQKWEEILDDQIQNGNVLGVRNDTNTTVIIDLDPTVNRYSLTMPKIGVGGGVEQPEPVYVLGAEGSAGSTVPKNSATDVTFEVRDKYNNPVRGEEINVTLAPSGPGGSLASSTVTTDAEGHATVRYNTPNPSVTPVNQEIWVSINTTPNTPSPNPDFTPATDPADLAYTATIVDRQIPTGAVPTTSINSLNSDCATTSDGGLLGTTLLGSEAADITIDWETSVSSGSISSVTIEMVDTTNGQLAASTRYSPNTDSIDETITLRDQRTGDDSCDKEYELTVTAQTDGRQVDSVTDTEDVPA